MTTFLQISNIFFSEMYIYHLYICTLYYIYIYVLLYYIYINVEKNSLKFTFLHFLGSVSSILKIKQEKDGLKNV